MTIRRIRFLLYRFYSKPHYFRNSTLPFSWAKPVDGGDPRFKDRLRRFWRGLLWGDELCRTPLLQHPVFGRWGSYIHFPWLLYCSGARYGRTRWESLCYTLRHCWKR